MIKPVDTSDQEIEETAPGAGLTARTDAFFGDDTPLRRAPEFGGRPYEPRPQQRTMALAVAEAFASGRHLCVEAPTGVGKTFAYLVPGIEFALQTGLPVVVSTHTISLQEQIMHKDIPVLRNLLGREFRAALGKGRANYVCLRRLLATTGHQQEYLPAADLVPDLARIGRWAAETRDGSRSDLDFEPPPPVWEAVCCEMGNCLGTQCPQYQSCFFMRARALLMRAHVIVANHAMFFTDMGMKATAGEDGTEVGILPRFGAVVLDEGHTVEETAAMHLGLRLSSFGVRRTLQRLYNSERNRGLLVDVTCTPARLAVIRAAEVAERFFTRVGEALDERDSGPLRYTRAGSFPDLLAEPLDTVRGELAVLAKAESDPGRRQELTALTAQVEGFREGFHQFLNMTEAKHVYWLERQGAKGRTVAFNAVPVDVGPLLQKSLFSRDFTVVVTSATLAVRKSMQYFMRRVGATNAETLILDSPFDFARQVKFYVPLDMPNPNDTANFVPAACDHIRRFLRESDGHAFVLFTSYRMMQDMALELDGFFKETGMPLLVQGDGLPRTKLLEAFRRTPRAVLFGTDSFWTGVDVPGEALINVIIVKLPFAVPDHPLIAARLELIEAQGGRPFDQYTLPEAVLKFRQGFGRLIRSRDDHGIVVVLDNRIIHSRYGLAFLESLPDCQRLIF